MIRRCVVLANSGIGQNCTEVKMSNKTSRISIGPLITGDVELIVQQCRRVAITVRSRTILILSSLSNFHINF